MTMKAEEISLIESALNHYWHDANEKLNNSSVSLGDIERQQLEIRRTKLKVLMKDLESTLSRPMPNKEKVDLEETIELQRIQTDLNERGKSLINPKAFTLGWQRCAKWLRDYNTKTS